MLGIILDIILIVLKVIGILLLSILGLFILTLLIVLFVPIRYKSNGQFDKTEAGLEHEIYAKITWLLHIVSIKFQRVDNKNVLVFKIFGIDLLNRKKTRKKVKNRTGKKTSSDNMKQTTDISRNIVENNEAKPEVNINKNIVNQEATSIKDNLIQETKTEDNAKKEHIKPKFKDRIKSIINKLKNICEKIKNINNVKNSFIEYLKRDTSKNAIKEIKNIIFKLFKHVLPRKLKAIVGFGFENPATTGTVLGYASIFYGIYGDNLELEPDFDKQVLYGKYKLKGRIRICSLLMVAWKLYRNKWIREFITFSKETVKDL